MIQNPVSFQKCRTVIFKKDEISRSVYKNADKYIIINDTELKSSQVNHK